VDLLAVSYSANDYVGHRYGPDANESHDMALRVDKLIGDLLRSAELQAGVGRVLAVLSADHGVAPVPEVNAQRKLPGGRTSGSAGRDAVEKALSARFGAGVWVRDSTESGYYLNPNPIPGRTLDRADVERVAAEALRAQPHVFRVYTRTQLLNGAAEMDSVGVRVRNGFNEIRSPDVMVINDPFYLGGVGGTNHGTPFSYDTHVPVIFFGPGVKPGHYHFRIMVNDIAPTLATLLDVEPPSGNIGRALHEIIK
jgi:arylsulfatase A-like enzyme